jgi:toxin YxiD
MDLEIRHEKKNNIALRFDKNFELYIQDIERATNRKIPDKQIEKLKEVMQNKDYMLLSVEERRKHRAQFNGKKRKIIARWEEETHQEWAKYTEPVYSKKGKVIRNIGQNYDVHHIIENSWGGDNEWYNMHPAKHPSEHQQDIHRRGGPADRIFNDESKRWHDIRSDIKNQRIRRNRKGRVA